MSMKLAPIERHQFIYNDRVVYEWDQTLTEVNLYVQVPEGVRGRDLDVTITKSHLKFGIKKLPPFINEELYQNIKINDSTWTLEDGILHITLEKELKGEPWPCVLKGHNQMNPMALDEEKKRLILEKFQIENPGFDFSGAEVTGSGDMIPNPRTYQGDSFI